MAPGGSFTSEIPGRYSSFMFWSTAALTLISCYIFSTHVYMSLATLNLRYQKVSQTLHGLRKKHRNTHLRSHERQFLVMNAKSDYLMVG